jgi:hypothetical protein
MSNPSVERLRKVSTFPQLVRYLREELDWPIAEDNFDDLVFRWDAEELGLDLKTAATISEIKQLRPLAATQPWGVFFIKFEPKQLPIGALRRILGQLVVKKRASSRKADQQTWRARDLLFISAHGSDKERHITFAHFNDPSNERDLPTLRVLGWDGDDTVLHMAHAVSVLRSKLAWPNDPRATAKWRDEWSSAFELRPRQVIQSSKDLASRLADLAKGIRDRAKGVLDLESERGRLRRLHRAFQAALIHDLSEADFADMFAQTITYGLFSAAVSSGAIERNSNLIAGDISAQVPVTNPFLKELLEDFLRAGGRKGKLDFDELGVQDVVDLLNSPDTHLDAVLRDFGNRTRGEDPVIHFYESFLGEYDKAKKVSRGVFYTPQPVVSHIVRSVHEKLQSNFGLSDGLADITTWGEMLKRHAGMKLPPLTDDPNESRTISENEPFVQILDPATGTATFLVEVIDVIFHALSSKWKSQGLSEAERLAAWNEYVPKHLLSRIHAFELMMAPYAIAHMKVGLKLLETGYEFGSPERLRLFLTNALEPWQKELKLPDIEALAHEAATVNAVKQQKRFTVIIGNPPYAGISSNMTASAQQLVDAYRLVDGVELNERKVWLQDDYVKFVRKAQLLIDLSGAGVLGFITNHGYLDNPTFRGMRRSLMHSFSKLWLLDLHGNANKREQAPYGADDKNVFDIRQGVAICVGVRNASEPEIKHADLWGSRDRKYDTLEAHGVDDREFGRLNPDAPYYLFKPQDADCRAEYEQWMPLPQAMPANGVGMVTARDALCIDFNADVLWNRVRRFASLAPEAAREEFSLGPDVQSWKVKWAQADVRESGPHKRYVRPALYRPFDVRYTYYTGRSSGFICRPVMDTMRHMLNNDNVGLITTRSTKDKWDVHVTRHVCGHKTCSAYDINSLFPLYTVEEGLQFGGEERPVNFSPGFLKAFAEAMGLKRDKASGFPLAVAPEDIFHFAYAVFHSPGYRSRYYEFLKIEFPRIPLTPNMELFRELAKRGRELVSIHLLESKRLESPITKVIGGGSREVEKVSWAKDTVWLDRDRTVGFKGVEERVWKHYVGGYQVCEKWLKDRRGRILSDGEVEHYQRIVVALSETLRIEREVDEVIDRHGGWPGAFEPAGVQS